MPRPTVTQTRLLSVGLASLALIGYAAETVLLGVAIFPGVWLCHWLWALTTAAPMWARILWISMAGAAAYFLYGVVLILLVGLLHSVLRLNLREGAYPLISLQAIKWAMSTALKSPVSITFLNVLLLTPFAAIFYRLMGAKIGRGVQINAKSCADPSLLEIGDQSVIGGHATIVGHLFEEGRLILKRVRIGKRVVVGLNAIILPGAEIGDGASIAAGAVVPKDTRIAPRSVYLGATVDGHDTPKHPGSRHGHSSVPPPEGIESWR
jgi:acetyltransferase-like isoleucine patch superfamily enzyme